MLCYTYIHIFNNKKEKKNNNKIRTREILQLTKHNNPEEYLHTFVSV